MRDWPPGVNADACNALFGRTSTLKDRWMGDKSYVCQSIAPLNICTSWTV